MRVSADGDRTVGRQFLHRAAPDRLGSVGDGWTPCPADKKAGYIVSGPERGSIGGGGGVPTYRRQGDAWALKTFTAR